MSIDEKIVAKISRLSRLQIPEGEKQHVAEEIGKIIDWVEQLKEVNVEGIAPLSSVNDMALRWRTDKVTDGDKVDQVLANAPAKVAGFFTVPKVIE